MHRIDGPGATVDGKFTEGDPVGGIQATVVTDDFLNDVQEELISILVAAGVAPVKGTQDQALQSIYKLIQAQKATAFTTAGTSTALTLTPVPAISAYAANQRFSVKFHVDSGVNPTLNASGKGDKPIKQYDSVGTKIAAKFASNQLGDLVYDGADFVLLNAAPPAVAPQNLLGIRGAFSELAGSASGMNALATWTAKELQVMSAVGAYKTLRNVNVSISLAASGLNGLDTGASTISTWYYAFVIWNETSGVVGGIYSLSPAVPALPAGFTHYARIGAVRSDAVTANKFPCAFTQQGNKTTWTIAPGTNMTFTPSIAFGLGGSLSAGGLLAANVGAFVPPTSAQIILFAYNTGGSTLCAPSNAFGNVSDPANPVPIIANPAGGSFSACIQAEMLLKSNSIYWAANGSNAKIGSVGWVDNL